MCVSLMFEFGPYVLGLWHRLEIFKTKAPFYPPPSRQTRPNKNRRDSIAIAQDIFLQNYYYMTSLSASKRDFN